MSRPTLSRPWRFGNLHEINRSDVLPGQSGAQNYTVVGIQWHIGVILRCKKCRKTFEFTAEEQRHWYEKLRFWADSVPVECFECRGASRTIVNFHKRLSKVLATKEMTIGDYNEIVAIAEGLLLQGVQLSGRLGQKIRMAAKRADHRSRVMVLERVK
jgi:gamma-glutamyl-gamma-aminobutyrate hydrolase PuuD